MGVSLVGFRGLGQESFCMTRSSIRTSMREEGQWRFWTAAIVKIGFLNFIGPKTDLIFQFSTFHNPKVPIFWQPVEISQTSEKLKGCEIA